MQLYSILVMHTTNYWVAFQCHVFSAEFHYCFYFYIVFMATPRPVVGGHGMRKDSWISLRYCSDM